MAIQPRKVTCRCSATCRRTLYPQYLLAHSRGGGGGGMLEPPSRAHKRKERNGFCSHPIPSHPSFLLLPRAWGESCTNTCVPLQTTDYKYFTYLLHLGTLAPLCLHPCMYCSHAYDTDGVTEYGVRSIYMYSLYTSVPLFYFMHNEQSRVLG